MPTQYETVVDLAVALMNGISGIGVVHNRKRYKQDQKEFLDLFRTTIGGVQQVRGWLVSSPSQKRKRGPAQAVLETISLYLYGYMSANDALSTERTFFALTETIADTFQNHIHLGQVGGAPPAYVADAALPQIIRRDYAKIAGILVHYAEISIDVTVYKSITYTD
jgi:hypothetical protein